MKNDDRTTGLVSTLRYSIDGKDTSSLKYTYDANGNITVIRENGKLKARYAYDSVNRLVREDNKDLNKTVVFTYDAGGNISYRSERTFTLEEEVFADDNTLFSYKGDQLVAVNENNEFEYDVLGNPTKYFGKDLSWSRVRQLDGITDGSSEINFLYEANGLRSGKISASGVSKYVYNGRLEAEIRAASVSSAVDKILYFNYGLNGISGFTVKNDTTSTEYFYRKNAQGDITHIFDNEFNLVAKYEYDAWGNHTVIEYTSGNIGALNPIRYRGYYYDVETGLYYLKSRYYDPDTGRFINADDPSVLDTTKGDINGYNLYAYCGCNPVMGYDPDGHFNWGNFCKIVAGVVIIGALVVGSILTGGALSVVLAGAAIGAIGGAIGSTVSTAITGEWDNFGNSFLIGTIAGGISGAVSATSLGIIGQIGINALIGLGSYATTAGLNGDKITVGGLVSSFVFGGIAGAIGGAGMMKGNTTANIFVESGGRNFIAAIGSNMGKDLLKSLCKVTVNAFFIGGFLTGLYSVLLNKRLNPNHSFWGW
ncbi:MAG: RHS repeat-associated core domain-containing protein [Clostridiales bacterium]|nr:RHS repeat-associated core domain-containing protein [Clostridiales bacterium]